MTILPLALWWQQQNVNQTSKSQQTPHTSPSRASYVVAIVRIWEEIDRVITALHCITKLPASKYNKHTHIKHTKVCQGRRFKNTYELLNLRALKFSIANKIYIFQCMGKILCMEFITMKS